MSESKRMTIPLPVLLFNVLVPVLGIVFLGWGALEVIYLYFFETVLIGLLNIPKILLAQGDRVQVFGQDLTEAVKENPQLQQQSKIKVFLAVFFVMHYGIFLSIQGVFIFDMISYGVRGSSDLALQQNSAFYNFFYIPYSALQAKNLWLSVILLTISQLFDFILRFLGNGGYKTEHPIVLMIAPYKRVFVQQVVVIFGGMIIMFVHAPAGVAILLIIIKTYIDVWIDSGRFQLKLEPKNR